jgi:hypothetical protein
MYRAEGEGRWNVELLIVLVLLLALVLKFAFVGKPLDVISDIWNFLSGLLSGGIQGAIDALLSPLKPLVLAFQIFLFLIFILMIGSGTGRLIYITVMALIVFGFPYLSFPGDWLQNQFQFLGIPILSSTTWNIIVYGFLCAVLFPGRSAKVVVKYKYRC